MSLHNISVCRYLTDISGEWSQDHYRARNIVRAIKGDTFNGYAFFRVCGVLRRLDSKNIQTAVDWFVDRIAEEVQFTGKSNTICPIPDSQSTPSSTRVFRTLALAVSLAQRMPKLKVWPHLKFKQPMQRKIRDEDLLFRNLVCTAPIPTGDIVLLDDVCTTGSHARAAQRRLVKEGAEGHISAISVARTMLDPNEVVFGFRCDEL